MSCFVIRIAAFTYQVVVRHRAEETLSSLMFTWVFMMWVYYLMYLTFKLHRVEDGTWPEEGIRGFFSHGRKASRQPLMVSRATQA